MIKRKINITIDSHHDTVQIYFSFNFKKTLKLIHKNIRMEY